MIMIRRLMWDYMGWNLTWGATEKVDRHEALERHPWLFSGYHNDQERNALFMQYVKQHHDRGERQQSVGVEERKTGDGALATYAPQYRSAQLSGGGAPTDGSAVADDLALQPHEKFDVHLNVEAATTVHANQRPNVDHDIFFSHTTYPHTIQTATIRCDRHPTC
jgi:hypothetical protein